MDRVRPSNPRLATLEPYDPKYVPADVLLSANESTRNLPRDVLAAALDELARIDYNRYPDPLANALRDQIAEANGLVRGQVLIGNGGDELLFDTLLAWGGEGRTLLNVPPAFSVYELYAQVTGTRVVNVPRRADLSIDEEAVIARAGEGDIDVVMVTSPNNPSGDLADPAFVERLLDATDALVLIDEAYFEFAQQTVLPLLARHRNLAILRTFSKAYSLAAARVGYLFAAPEVIDEYLKVRQPYSVNALTQTVARVAYSMREAFEPAIRDTIAERERVCRRLAAMDGVDVWPSRANFVLVRLQNAHEDWQRMYDEDSVLVRDFSGTPGLEGCLRLSIGQHDENDRMLEALESVL